MFERVLMKQLNDHLWLMDDNHEATGYIIAGSERAMVIDTMNGYEDVRAIAATVTDKPAFVVNTHGHCDHIYGNVTFDEAYLCEADLPIAKAHAERQGISDRMPPFRFVKDGDVFDLGGLTVEVIALPGHTPGGICLLLKEDRILFTGDAINRHLWLQLKEALPVKDAAAAIDRISSVKERADRILHGHARDFEDISLIDKLRNGLEELMTGNCIETDEEYNWFGGKALQHRFDDESVIVYTKEKLIDKRPEQ